MINNDTIKTKYFALGNYEKENDQEGNIRELYYISSPSGLTAILQKSGSQDSIFYVHTDYLGSYDVITTATGTIRQRYNFDPWGRRRNPMDWSYNTDSTALLFDRGFTGHEHLDQFGLINMNGRVYDPLLAMFLGPDNYVQAPDFTQNFNRYAYCLNNPLNYTDPDGEWVITALITLGNMWLNGAMVNNFQFNPAKWDWSSPKTWVGLGQSTFLGWQMGTRFETKIKANRFWKGYDRAVKMDDISIQETGETKLPDDYDLYGFQKTHFPKYTHRNKVNMLYDNEIVKSQAEQGKLPPMAFTSSQLVNDKYQIYFGEAAFRSQGHLYLSMGHEFIHVAHFERFGALFNKNMSEYAAYIWNAGYLNSRGYSEWGVFKESALKWGNYDLSRNGSFLKIEPYLILKQNNYGLPFFNYYNLFN
jgi:RHS repeat-associated protein